MPRVLIAGCGYVGAALAGELVAAGDTVFALSRSGRGAPEGATVVRADVSRPSTLRDLPPGLDLVFYCVSAGASTEAAYRAAYVDGPRALLAALADAGARPRRVLYTSSSGVYRRGEGEWVDEQTPPEPDEPTARALLCGEQVVLSSGLPATVVRLAGIYGPGRTRTIEAVKSGAMALTGGAPEYTNRIHRDDCAGVLAHLARLPAAAPLYLGVDCEPVSRDDVVRFLGGELGITPSVRPAPPGSGPGQGSNRRCSNRRLLATGYVFRFPTFREGYRALLAKGGGAGR